jgi:hypothetical protein
MMAADDSGRVGLFGIRPDRSPETAGQRLDGLVQVTSARRWLALSMALALLSAAVLYCFFGGAPTQVAGTGFLLGPTGLDQVATPSDGTVVSVEVDAGEAIKAGQVVAVVRLPDGRMITIASQIDGEVLLALVSPGDVVEHGRSLVEVLPAGTGREAQVFVSALQGSSVRPGMQVRVNPVNAPAAQYGSIVGTVVSVSKVPLSSAAVSSLVGSNDELAELIHSRTAPLQVQVALEGGDTATGFRWTSGRGPADPVLPATVLNANVILKQGRPIDLLLDAGSGR